MIRKNLILVMIKNGDDNDEMYLSNYIPGCLDFDEYIYEIKYYTKVGYPQNIIQNLTNLKINSKIIFNMINEFCFNPSKTNDNKLDIVSNLYIINATEEYKDINCSSLYIDNYYCENGFISSPKTISCFSIITTERKSIRYEVRSTVI